MLVFFVGHLSFQLDDLLARVNFLEFKQVSRSFLYLSSGYQPIVWDQYHRILGIIWGQYNPILGVILGRYNPILGIMLGRYNPILVVMLGQQNPILGVILGQYNPIIGIMLGQYNPIFGVILSFIKPKIDFGRTFPVWEIPTEITNITLKFTIFNPVWELKKIPCDVLNLLKLLKDDKLLRHSNTPVFLQFTKQRQKTQLMRHIICYCPLSSWQLWEAGAIYFKPIYK